MLSADITGRRGWIEAARIVAAFTIIYFVSDAALNMFAFADGWTIIWPLNGVTVALLLKRPRSAWPWMILGIEIGTGIGECLIEDFSPSMEFFQRICSAVEVVICARALPACTDVEQWLRVPKIFRKVVVAIILGPGISGVLAAILFHLAKGQSYTVAFNDWATADALGIAATMPLILSAGSPQMQALFKPHALPRTLMVLGVVFAGTAVVFSVSRYPLVFLLYPLLLLADSQLAFAGSAIAVAGVCPIAMYFTTRSIGPFGEWPADLWVPGNVALQIFFAFHMTALFPASVLFMERRNMAEELRASNARLTVLAAIDGLTGIANRRSFDERLSEEWRRAYRTRTLLSIAMIDLDNFKQFNDLYGHVAGDKCLRAVAAVLVAQVHRPEDVVARFGGEEFAMLLPNTTAEGTALVTERIRKAVVELGVSHLGSTWEVVTVSVGHTTLVPAQSEGQSEFIQLADAALYQAKHGGRNRVETLTSLAALQATQAQTDGGTSSRNRLLRILGRNEG